MGEMPLAIEKGAAKLSFQLLNGAGQRGLRHVTFFSRSRKIQLLRHGKKIADLMHLHDTLRARQMRPSAAASVFLLNKEKNRRKDRELTGVGLHRRAPAALLGRSGLCRASYSYVLSTR